MGPPLLMNSGQIKQRTKNMVKRLVSSFLLSSILAAGVLLSSGKGVLASDSKDTKKKAHSTSSGRATPTKTATPKKTVTPTRTFTSTKTTTPTRTATPAQKVDL